MDDEMEKCRRSRHAWALNLVCSACGIEFPAQHEADCPRPPDAIAVLLDAVASGGTLMVTGPDPLGGDPTINATLESSSGASYASVAGAELGTVLVELARRWLLARPATAARFSR